MTVTSTDINTYLARHHYIFSSELVPTAGRVYVCPALVKRIQLPGCRQCRPTAAELVTAKMANNSLLLVEHNSREKDQLECKEALYYSITNISD